MDHDRPRPHFEWLRDRRNRDRHVFRRRRTHYTYREGCGFLATIVVGCILVSALATKEAAAAFISGFAFVSLIVMWVVHMRRFRRDAWVSESAVALATVLSIDTPAPENRRLLRCRLLVTEYPPLLDSPDELRATGERVLEGPYDESMTEWMAEAQRRIDRGKVLPPVAAPLSLAGTGRNWLAHVDVPVRWTPTSSVQPFDVLPVAILREVNRETDSHGAREFLLVGCSSVLPLILLPVLAMFRSLIELTSDGVPDLNPFRRNRPLQEPVAVVLLRPPWHP